MVHRNLSSVLAVLAIIAVLIIAGPVQAVRVNLGTDKAVYRSGDVVTFQAGIDIQRGETVPVVYLELEIKGFPVCVFLPDGTNSCPSITIIPKNTGVVLTGDLYGRGFGFVADEKRRTQATDFGYGYGFNEELRKSGYNSELAYDIIWDFEADGAPDGKYEAELRAIAENAGKQYTYTTTSTKKFHIKTGLHQKTATVSRITISSRDGEIDHIDSEDEFVSERNTISASLKRTETSISEDVSGRVSVNLYGETPAGKRYTITIRMKDYTEIDAFQKDLVDLTGTADIRFYSYARGVWDPMTRTRIGYESPVRERYTMPVHVVFENGRVTVETGPELDIFAEFTNNRFVYRNN